MNIQQHLDQKAHQVETYGFRELQIGTVLVMFLEKSAWVKVGATTPPMTPKEVNQAINDIELGMNTLPLDNAVDLNVFRKEWPLHTGLVLQLGNDRGTTNLAVYRDKDGFWLVKKTP